MAQHRYSPEVIYDYVEELDANLVCAICQSALVDPVTTTSCKHTFCRDCIERAISINPQCPIDRSALTSQSLRETEQLVKLMLDELKVKCAAGNCGVVMQRGLLLAHLRTCPMAVIMCEDGECGLKMPKLRVSEHRAYECFQRKMECDRCGVLLTFKDQTPRHLKPCISGSTTLNQIDTCDLCGDQYGSSRTLHKWSCPSARVPCTHTTRGCPTIILRSELASHLKICPFEAMSTFFTANDARMKAMEERQEELVKEVSTLKIDLQRQRALAGTHGWRSLGSTQQWRARGEGLRGGLGESETPSSGPGLEPDLDVNIERNWIPGPLPRPQSPETPTTSGPLPSSSAPTSPPSGITPRAAADFAASRTLFTPSFGSRQSYADWAFNHLADPPANTHVALEGAVARLRRVILQLAAGLDTMERRNEVRNMTESLRILEEVGALRAIVNTIRLQVMIDRPGTPNHRRSFGMNTLSSSQNNDLTRSSSNLPPSINQHDDVEPDEESTSIHESIAFSSPDIGSSSSISVVRPTANTRAHAWALEGISSRRAGRDASVIGGVGGIVGEPMGIPVTPPERCVDPMEEVTGARSTSRLGRAVSNGLLSIRSGRRNQGTGPRL